LIERAADYKLKTGLSGALTVYQRSEDGVVGWICDAASESRAHDLPSSRHDVNTVSTVESLYVLPLADVMCSYDGWGAGHGRMTWLARQGPVIERVIVWGTRQQFNYWDRRDSKRAVATACSQTGIFRLIVSFLREMFMKCTIFCSWKFR